MRLAARVLPPVFLYTSAECECYGESSACCRVKFRGQHLLYLMFGRSSPRSGVWGRCGQDGADLDRSFALVSRCFFFVCKCHVSYLYASCILSCRASLTILEATVWRGARCFFILFVFDFVGLRSFSFVL